MLCLDVLVEMDLFLHGWECAAKVACRIDLHVFRILYRTRCVSRWTCFRRRNLRFMIWERRGDKSPLGVMSLFVWREERCAIMLFLRIVSVPVPFSFSQLKIE
ncbi:unnamed protein product [Arabis nemorensis]|uniref:Uncharacterized protein n=1 Tax=Arabis nemorensis TaxID=586526 RepID=A0A565C5P6_9BRAS|nr:unnamed protein product [Arabis nemorensis]